MGLVAASMVRNGMSEPVRLDQHETWAFKDRDFVWIGLVEPSEPELRLLAGRFGLHELAVADALTTHQLPKIETYGDQLFIVVRTARLEGDEIAYGQTYIFVGQHFIITVRYGSTRTHADLRTQLESSVQGMRHGVDYVLHGILDFIVDGYMPIFAAIEEEVLRFEARILDEPLTKDDVRRIFAWRGELTRFARLTEPMLEMSSRLQHLDLPCIKPVMRPYFRDVDDHVRRLATMVEGLRDVLRSAFEISILLEQQQQSVVTRKLAAWAAILAIPTAIAGIYGMNFEYMPELKLRYGYFTVLGLIALICGLLFARFKRIGWL
jgi:magnesium transporter